MPGSFFRRWRRPPDPKETIERGPGGVDEVKVDLGPDEGGPGLLERWSVGDATSTGEPTRAPSANSPAPELPEETIRSSRAAIPFDRTIPRVEKEPTPVADVTVTEAVSRRAFPWWLVLAAMALVALALSFALVR